MTTDLQLDELIKALPKSVEPTRDCWPTIAAQLTTTAQINNPQSNRYWWPSAAAITLTILAFWQWPQSERFAPVAQVQPASKADNLAYFTQVNVSQNQRMVAQSIQLQLRFIEKVPAGFENWQQQLSILQSAGQLISQALEYDPNNHKLIRKLYQIQQQQLQYISALVTTSKLS